MACDNALNGAVTLVTIVISAGVLCLIAAAAVKVVRDKVRRLNSGAVRRPVTSGC